LLAFTAQSAYCIITFAILLQFAKSECVSRV